MTTLDLLKQNWRDGVRLPYPADTASIETLRGMMPALTPKGFAVESGLWEKGEPLLITIRRQAGILFLQLQTRGEIV